MFSKIKFSFYLGIFVKVNCADKFFLKTSLKALGFIFYKLNLFKIFEIFRYNYLTIITLLENNWKKFRKSALK
jgi:hypothetical protein